QPHRFLNGAFELWIFTGDHVFGPVLDIDVRRNAFVLDRPSSVTCEEPAARRDHRPAVDERRRVGSMNEPAPGAFANQWTNLAALEHIRHQVAARSGHFVDDHHLRSPDTGGRTCERETIACYVVEVTIKVAFEDLDDVVGRGATAVESFVNDYPFFVLLREVVAIETAVTGLPGVGEIHVG